MFFLLKSNTAHRYFINLCHFLSDQGYTIVIRPSFGFLGHWQTREFLRQLPKVKFAFSCEGYSAKISDHNFIPDGKRLNYDYFTSSPARGSYFVPMCMVDTMYYYGFHREAEGYSRNESRNIRVFYAGNCAPSYRNSVIHLKFGLLDRVSMLRAVKTSFTNELSEAGELPEILRGDIRSKLTILERGVNYIKPRNLLEVLSRCSFILVPPGVVMPQTHFIVEGMSVGCIPILQYRKMFSLPLEHNLNCLYFADETDLTDVVKFALSLSTTEVARLRANVMAYFRSHLSIESVIKNIVHPETISIYLNAESVSVDLL